MSDFLDKLKKAVDEEEFNSDAAKKIIEINDLADTKTVAGSSEELDKRLEAAGVKNVSAEEAVALNSQYEKEMEKIKENDAINGQIATLIEIEDMVKLSINDMFDFISELEDTLADKLKEARSKHTDEFAKENQAYITLSQQIELSTGKFAEFYQAYLKNKRG